MNKCFLPKSWKEKKKKKLSAQIRLVVFENNAHFNSEKKDVTERKLGYSYW